MQNPFPSSLLPNNSTQVKATDVENMSLSLKKLKKDLKFDLCYNYANDMTKITNFRQCCQELNGDFVEGEVFWFICHIMGVKGDYDDTRNPIIQGDHKEEDIKEAFLRFYRKLLFLAGLVTSSLILHPGVNFRGIRDVCALQTQDGEHGTRITWYNRVRMH